MGNTFGCNWTIDNQTDEDFELVDSNLSFMFEAFHFPTALVSRQSISFHSELKRNQRTPYAWHREQSRCHWVYSCGWATMTFRSRPFDVSLFEVEFMPIISFESNHFVSNVTEIPYQHDPNEPLLFIVQYRIQPIPRVTLNPAAALAGCKVLIQAAVSGQYLQVTPSGHGAHPNLTQSHDQASEWTLYRVGEDRVAIAVVAATGNMFLQARDDLSLVGQSPNILAREHFQPIPLFGGQITWAFRSCNDQHYMGANTDGQATMTSSLGIRQRFLLHFVDLRGCTVAFVSHHGTFLRAQPGGEGTRLDQCTEECPDIWFNIIELDGNQVAIQSTTHKTYFRAHPGGEGATMDMQTQVGPWERFSLVPGENGTWGIRSAHNQFVRAHSNQDVVDTQTFMGEWEHYRPIVLEGPDAMVVPRGLQLLNTLPEHQRLSTLPDRPSLSWPLRLFAVDAHNEIKAPFVQIVLTPYLVLWTLWRRYQSVITDFEQDQSFRYEATYPMFHEMPSSNGVRLFAHYDAMMVIVTLFNSQRQRPDPISLMASFLNQNHDARDRIRPLFLPLVQRRVSWADITLPTSPRWVMQHRTDNTLPRWQVHPMNLWEFFLVALRIIEAFLIDQHGAEATLSRFLIEYRAIFAANNPNHYHTWRYFDNSQSPPRMRFLSPRSARRDGSFTYLPRGDRDTRSYGMWHVLTFQDQRVNDSRQPILPPMTFVLVLHTSQDDMVLRDYGRSRGAPSWQPVSNWIHRGNEAFQGLNALRTYPGAPHYHIVQVRSETDPSITGLDAALRWARGDEYNLEWHYVPQHNYHFLLDPDNVNGVQDLKEDQVNPNNRPNDHDEL